MPWGVREVPESCFFGRLFKNICTEVSHSHLKVYLSLIPDSNSKNEKGV